MPELMMEFDPQNVMMVYSLIAIHKFEAFHMYNKNIEKVKQMRSHESASDGVPFRVTFGQLQWFVKH